jgi:hypothetical protein
LLSACIVVPRGGHRGGGGYYSGEVIELAPPAPAYEVVGVAPGPGFFWIGGFWNWVGGRHQWVGGRWEAQRPGYAWTPHSWQRDGRGWRSNPGRWERR